MVSMKLSVGAAAVVVMVVTAQAAMASPPPGWSRAVSVPVGRTAVAPTFSSLPGVDPKPIQAVVAGPDAVVVRAAGDGRRWTAGASPAGPTVTPSVVGTLGSAVAAWASGGRVLAAFGSGLSAPGGEWKAPSLNREAPGAAGVQAGEGPSVAWTDDAGVWLSAFTSGAWSAPLRLVPSGEHGTVLGTFAVGGAIASPDARLLVVIRRGTAVDSVVVNPTSGDVGTPVRVATGVKRAEVAGSLPGAVELVTAAATGCVRERRFARSGTGWSADAPVVCAPRGSRLRAIAVSTHASGAAGDPVAVAVSASAPGRQYLAGAFRRTTGGPWRIRALTAAARSGPQPVAVAAYPEGAVVAGNLGDRLTLVSVPRLGPGYVGEVAGAPAGSASSVTLVTRERQPVLIAGVGATASRRYVSSVGSVVGTPQMSVAQRRVSANRVLAVTLRTRLAGRVRFSLTRRADRRQVLSTTIHTRAAFAATRATVRLPRMAIAGRYIAQARVTSDGGFLLQCTIRVG